MSREAPPRRDGTSTGRVSPPHPPAPVGRRGPRRAGPGSCPACLQENGPPSTAPDVESSAITSNSSRPAASQPLSPTPYTIATSVAGELSRHRRRSRPPRSRRRPPPRRSESPLPTDRRADRVDRQPERSRGPAIAADPGRSPLLSRPPRPSAPCRRAPKLDCRRVSQGGKASEAPRNRHRPRSGSHRARRRPPCFLANGRRSARDVAVFNELAKQAAVVDEPLTLAHFRHRSGVEVDIVIEQADGTIIAFEVKSATSVVLETSQGCGSSGTGWATASRPACCCTQEPDQPPSKTGCGRCLSLRSGVVPRR